MSVQLILLEDVADLGKIGDEVHVANGYARNYLLPLKKAELLTTAARRRVEAKKLKLQKEHEERIAVAKTMAEKIAALTLTIPVAAGENDKLYGSVSNSQIAAALLEQGIEIDRNVIDLAEPIRELGSFEVDIKLHAEVTAKAKVVVTRADA